jgi:hypothetical protein
MDVTDLRGARKIIEELPPEKVGQYVGGELLVSPRPAMGHALAASTLGEQLLGPFHRGRGGPGGWWIIDEPELHLGDDIHVPDLAGWRRDTLPVLPDVPAMTVARVRKLPAYARAGVGYAWLIDPAARTLEAFRREGERWVLLGAHAGNTEPHVEPFEEIGLDLSALWLPIEP